MAKKSSRVATSFLLILAGSLLLTACTSAPAKDLENLDAIYLEPGTVTESASPSEPAVQEYARDPDSEIEIDDQVGDGISLKIQEIQVSRGNAFLVIYNSQNFVVSEAFVTPQSQPVTLFFDIPILQSQELQAALDGGLLQRIVGPLRNLHGRGDEMDATAARDQKLGQDAAHVEMVVIIKQDRTAHRACP